MQTNNLITFEQMQANWRKRLFRALLKTAIPMVVCMLACLLTLWLISQKTELPVILAPGGYFSIGVLFLLFWLAPAFAMAGFRPRKIDEVNMETLKLIQEAANKRHAGSKNQSNNG